MEVKGEVVLVSKETQRIDIRAGGGKLIIDTSRVEENATAALEMSDAVTVVSCVGYIKKKARRTYMEAISLQSQ